MAESFEPYHVPQQSRRDKLRIVAQNQTACVENLQGCAGLLPLYDPSLLSSDHLLNAGGHDFHHHVNNQLSGCKGNPVCVNVKEEGMNLVGFVGSASHHPYLDPHSSLAINPTSIHDINNNSNNNIPFFYTPQNLQTLRDLDQSYNGGTAGEVVVYKPEPLSLAHESSNNNNNGRGLSLSLSSHHAHQTSLPLELNIQRYGSSIYGSNKVCGGGYSMVPGSTSNDDVSRSSVPLGPFTGYASILKGSRFLKPAQQLLEEFCDVGRGVYSEKITADSSLMDPPVETLSGSGINDDPLGSGDGGENRRKKSRLISMLDEVYFSNWTLLIKTVPRVFPLLHFS